MYIYSITFTNITKKYYKISFQGQKGFCQINVVKKLFEKSKVDILKRVWKILVGKSESILLVHFDFLLIILSNHIRIFYWGENSLKNPPTFLNCFHKTKLEK